MRINVYSQELTSEVNVVEKESNTGLVYTGIQMMLHSSPMLHHPPTTTPDWNIPGAEYSFTPFGEEV